MDELEEADFEDLDMLCDGVEAEKIADENQLFKDHMHKKMDEKLEKIKQDKV